MGRRLKSIRYAIGDVLYVVGRALGRVPEALARGWRGFWGRLSVTDRKRLGAALAAAVALVALFAVAVPRLPCSFPGGDSCPPADEADDVPGDPLMYSLRREIADLSAKLRLPAVYPHREWAEAGGLMSYGVDRLQVYRRAAEYVDKILKGAKPGDLPVEQPDQVRAGHQPQDRQGPRPDDPAVAPAAGGSGDRVMDRRPSSAAGRRPSRRAARRRGAAGGKSVRDRHSGRWLTHARTSSALECIPRSVAERGHVEGKNIAFEFRWASGNIASLDALAGELLRAKSMSSPLPARRRHSRQSRPPPRCRSSSSLLATRCGPDCRRPARPGRQRHRPDNPRLELSGKRLDFLRELLPTIVSRGALWTTNPAFALAVQDTEVAART